MVDRDKYGVSFSIKQCRNLGIDAHDCLDWLIAQGWRRFRLMSYWNECEKEQGVYDFTDLDWQLRRISRAKGVITLCLGVKQPRWPEYHWPAWALNLTESERTAALLKFLREVVQHARNHKNIISYQLENEVLLRGFGENIHINRHQLRAEFDLVKQLDPIRPIIMSTSNGWGIPLRRPIPDIVGFSYYSLMYKNGGYHQTVQRPWLHRLRRWLISIIWHRPTFIHELQAEPWGPKAIWEMPFEEQGASMGTPRITTNLKAAQSINAYPIDFWGAEWWYWQSLDHEATSATGILDEIDCQNL